MQDIILTHTPISTEQLLSHAEIIAGLSIRELADLLHIKTPPNLKKNKGWQGQVIEKALGICNNNRMQPDFNELGIELKTIPINEQGKPLETTYITYCPIYHTHNMTWENSHVKAKLNKILWIPILSSKNIRLEERILGMPILWSPNQQQSDILKTDWEEIMENIACGNIESINGKMGEYLHLRPKASNHKALTKGIGKEGKTISTLPRGFYLRTQLTTQIIQNYFH